MRNEINLLKQSMVKSTSHENLFKILKNIISLTDYTKDESFSKEYTIDQI